MAHHNKTENLQKEFIFCTYLKAEWRTFTKTVQSILNQIRILLAGYYDECPYRNEKVFYKNIFFEIFNYQESLKNINNT